MTHHTSTAHAARRRALHHVSVAVALALVTLGGFGSVSARANPSGVDWPQYLADGHGTGFTSETVINPSNAAMLAARTGWPVQLSNGAACPSANDYCSNTIASQPAIATVSGNTLVFVGSWNGDEYALCASSCNVNSQVYTSGQVVWSTYVGRTSGCGGPLNSRVVGVTGAAAVGTATVNNVLTTLVYVGAGGDIAQNGSVLSGATSQMFALNALTGAVVWQTPLGSAPAHYLWSSALLANGSVYAGMSSLSDCPLVQGAVYRLDPATGSVLNTFATVPNGCLGGSVWGSPSADASGNVYVATGNNGQCAQPEPYTEAVVKLSSTLGLLSSWQLPAKQQGSTDADFGSTPTLFTGTVTPSGASRSLLGIGCKNGKYYVFDAAAVAAGPVATLKIAAGGTDPQKGDGTISPSSWDGHLLYVAGGRTTIASKAYKGSLRAFNPNNFKTPVWQHGFTGYQETVLAAVTSSPGLATVGAGAFITVVNSSNGNTLDSESAAGFFGAPSIAHGVLYEGDTSGKVQAFSVNGQ